MYPIRELILAYLVHIVTYIHIYQSRYTPTKSPLVIINILLFSHYRVRNKKNGNIPNAQLASGIFYFCNGVHLGPAFHPTNSTTSVEYTIAFQS